MDFWTQFISDLSSTTSEAIPTDKKINGKKIEVIEEYLINSAECMEEEFIDSFSELTDDQNKKSDDDFVDENMNKSAAILKCDICNQSYANEDDLKTHQKCAHCPTIDLMCSRCPRTFTLKKLLIEHYLKRHNTKEGAVQCDMCQQSFKSKSNLRAHMVVVHMREKKRLIKHRKIAIVPHRWKCNFCSMPSYQSSMLLLNRHYNDVHRADERLKLLCQFCNDLFVSDKDMGGHISTEALILKCIICNKPFKCKTKQAIHQKIH